MERKEVKKKRCFCFDLALKDIKRIEINEPFAAVRLVSSLVLANFDRRNAEKIKKELNVNGETIPASHPIAVTGVSLLLSMSYELRRLGGGYGIFAICGEIGRAGAIIVEVQLLPLQIKNKASNR